MSGQHWLVVTEVEHESGFDDMFGESEVEHPPECVLDEEYGVYQCAIGFEQLNGGDLRWILNYSGTPVTKPGRYPIVHWHNVIRGFDYTEHDAGVAIGMEP